MKKNMRIVQSIFFFIILIFSGCIIDSPGDNQKDNPKDEIPEGLYVSISGDKKYSSIQDAIDAASENETIFVFAGFYNETITINKTINLIGENPETTIIDGNGSNNIITITNTEFCNISGFTVQNSGSNKAGVDLKASKNNLSNNIFQENYDGIYASNANHNSIFNNKFRSHQRYGIYLSGADHNILKNNQFINNSYGARIKARNNEIIRNKFKDNDRGLYFCCYAEKNIVYHNDFINNSNWNTKDNHKGQIWYNADISKGNYWDDYEGNDKDTDGIGDTPYNITSDGTKQDDYPLMNPH